jgi:hypothetical protein
MVIVINENVCKHWILSLILLNLLNADDGISYLNGKINACNLPILNYIRCCDENFTLMIPDLDLNILEILDKIVPSPVRNPALCGDISCCQPMILNYEKDDEELFHNISFGVNETKLINIWTMLIYIGIALILLLLAIKLVIQCCRKSPTIQTQYTSLS